MGKEEKSKFQVFMDSWGKIRKLRARLHTEMREGGSQRGPLFQLAWLTEMVMSGTGTLRQ